MRQMREIDFPVKQFADCIDFVTFVGTYCCWNVDMCTTESSRNYESRVRQADTSKVHSKPVVFRSRIVKWFRSERIVTE